MILKGTDTDITEVYNELRKDITRSLIYKLFSKDRTGDERNKDEIGSSYKSYASVRFIDMVLIMIVNN